MLQQLPLELPEPNMFDSGNSSGNRVYTGQLLPQQLLQQLLQQLPRVNALATGCGKCCRNSCRNSCPVYTRFKDDLASDSIRKNGQSQGDVVYCYAEAEASRYCASRRRLPPTPPASASCKRRLPPVPPACGASRRSLPRETYISPCADGPQEDEYITQQDGGITM